MADYILRADAIALAPGFPMPGLYCEKSPEERAALNAVAAYQNAIRALPAVEVGVRELEWVDFDGRGAKAQAWNAANYLIQKWSDGRYEISASYPGYSTSIDGIDRFYPTIEAAKAAAQADYASRIRSALTATPAQDVCDLLAALDKTTAHGQRVDFSHVGHSLSDASWHVHLAGFRSQDDADAFLTAAIARVKEATHG